MVASLVEDADAAMPLRTPIEQASAPPVSGLHLQFGADASSEMVVSWHTLEPVQNPRVILGRLDGKFEQTAEANPARYMDAKSGKVAYAYHARLSRL